MIISDSELRYEDALIVTRHSRDIPYCCVHCDLAGTYACHGCLYPYE